MYASNRAYQTHFNSHVVVVVFVVVVFVVILLSPEASRLYTCESFITAHRHTCTPPASNSTHMHIDSISLELVHKKRAQSRRADTVVVVVVVVVFRRRLGNHNRTQSRFFGALDFIESWMWMLCTLNSLSAV